jgi:hypothetical protein
MKRVVVAGAVALVCLVVPAKVDAQSSSEVTFVNAAGANAVDLYMGPTSASSLSLAAAGVPVDGVVGLGQVPTDSYRVLICNSVGSPAGSVTSCATNGATTFLDKKAGIGDDQPVELVFGATAEGLARLSKFNVDTECVAPGGKVMIANVSASGPAAVTLDGTVVAGSLASGKAVKTTAPAGSHSVTVDDGVALSLSGSLDVAAQHNTVAYVRGAAGSYAIAAVHQVPLDCGSTTPTNPTGGAGANSGGTNATTTAVTPKFTG